MDNQHQKLARKTIVLGIAYMANSASALLLVVLLTKILGTYDYGIWSQVNVIIVFAVMLGSLNLPFAITRLLASKKDIQDIRREYYSAVLLTIISTVVVGGIIICISNVLADTFFGGNTYVVVVVGLAIPLYALEGLYLNLFRTFQQLEKVSVILVLETIGRIGLIALAIVMGFGILGAVIAMLVAKIVVLLVVVRLVKKQIGFSNPQFYKVSEYLSLSLPAIPANMGSMVTAFADRYVISYLISVMAVGYYSVGCIVGNTTMILSGLLSFAVFPAISKYYDENNLVDVKIIFSYVIKLFLTVSIPYTFGLIIIGKQVISIFTTPDIATHSYDIAIMASLSTMVLGVANIVIYIFALVKKTKIIGILWVITATVNLALNILLVPRMGILGAAVATLISYILITVIVFYYAAKEMIFKIDINFIIKSIVASIVMVVVVWLISPQGIIALASSIVVGVLIYIIVLYLLKGFCKEEAVFIKELLKVKINGREKTN